MSKPTDSLGLSLFSSRVNAICEEMGAVLRRSAFSPNIKDRLDFSCAIFNQKGELCAQAAHIPVHLGSMAYAMRSIVSRFEWREGDMLILNDPYLGGTHLPDVTLVGPVFIQKRLFGFIANRAHHADIGCESPGSMPLSSSLQQEGLIISPQFLMRQGELLAEVYDKILNSLASPQESRGDFNAQISCNQKGGLRLAELIRLQGEDSYLSKLKELNHYAQTLAEQSIANIPNGEYCFEDFMDDDGLGNESIKICVKIQIKNCKVSIDFAGTAAQTQGNINCPISVTAAAVYYVFRCLMPKQTPATAGSFKPIEIKAPSACLLNSLSPAAVAAGNVETSSRIVDVLLGALAQAIPDLIPAASQGSMNNIAMGYRSESGKQGLSWSYYETIGGGMGASAQTAGLSAVQTHMTNTLNTPIEVLESKYPLRVKQYSIRQGSGGYGLNPGGDGIIREFEFLGPTEVTLLTERRRYQPWGLKGGDAAKVGVNLLNGTATSAKTSLSLKSGDVLTIKTPGGGAYGQHEK